MNFNILSLFKKAPPEPEVVERGSFDPVAPIPQAPTNPQGIYTLDNPWPFLVPQSPKKHPYDAVDTTTWRNMARRCDILKSVINHLKSEIATIPIEIVAREDEDNSDATKEDIQKATKFFQSMSSGLGGFRTRRSHFESQIFDDLLTIGCVAVHISRNGLGEVLEVIPIDCTTIRPVIDAYGFAPDHAYEQYVMGVKVEEYTKDELLYEGLYPVTWTPYFESPVEMLLSPIMSSMKADEWNRMWLTQGTTPADMVSLPQDWNPEQIRQFVTYFDENLAGNTGNRVKTKFLPGGSERLTAYSRKDNDSQEFELWLMKRICSLYGVQPASIGYGDLQYKTSQKNSTDITSMYGAGVLLEFRKNLYDELLIQLGFENLEVINVAPWEEDANQRADRLIKLTEAGIYSTNEARKELGLDPLEKLQEDEEADPSQTDDVVAEKPTNGDENVSENRVLQNWKNKAIRRFKDGKSLNFTFNHEGLNEEVATRVSKGLPLCTSLAEVVSLFQEDL